ncbi:hypothetical protein [Caulobacter sp. 17J80-11]|uniref:hypothetical protein n=1 Tax=Caulobacter sp. 17J80-11 TaxID=2763502 RepID=UPI001653CC0D|nr:hypothetical protein [Caulobacter sp. 17J80-11]MBC6982968.1 hypothetical protein [Caulobacter sp. 17J80-11]
MSATYALAAWRMIEHAWRTDGTLAGLAGGCRPDGFEAFPRLSVADTGRLDRVDQVRAERTGEEIRLRLPLAILDVWIDIDEVAEALIEAITAARLEKPCDDLGYS